MRYNPDGSRRYLTQPIQEWADTRPWYIHAIFAFLGLFTGFGIGLHWSFTKALACGFLGFVIGMIFIRVGAIILQLVIVLGLPAGVIAALYYILFT